MIKIHHCSSSQRLLSSLSPPLPQFLSSSGSSFATLIITILLLSSISCSRSFGWRPVSIAASVVGRGHRSSFFPSTTNHLFLVSSSSYSSDTEGESKVNVKAETKGDSKNHHSTIMSSSSPIYKRAKIDSSTTPVSSKVIGTHSGTFQADEAMGVWMIRQLKEYRNAKVVRTRDKSVLEPLDIVLDVGGIYDHNLKRYDHHQRGYEEYFYDTSVQDRKDHKQGEIRRVTKLSASGLIYRHYGKELIKTYYPDITPTDLETAYHKIYDSLLEALDAIDTGVEIAEEVLYRDSTGLSRRVGRLNPRWNEDPAQSLSPDERFEDASAMCGKDFMDVMIQVMESEIPARTIVEQSLLQRFEKTDASGEIICFPAGGLPWKSHLYELEKKHEIPELIKFVLYTDEGGMWRIQAVTVEGKAFENRLSLPEAWRGVRDEDLTKIAGIPGCKFCHAAGFIGGNETYEGALKMAQVALATTT